VQWAVTDDKIGFIAIYGWDEPEVPDQGQAALEKMRDTRGLIVDVRLNGGGSEDQAMQFAGRFLKKEFVYAYSQSRNGPDHTNLTRKNERDVAPSGPWRYDRPVVLLIGQKCMSSNESFIGMMTGDSEVTTLGDHTCGSSGNPEVINLPLEMTVSVPQWIDYLPDGTPLDERGFQPQVVFEPLPGSFEGDRDDLLVAALKQLRQSPLPQKPIAGPAFMTDKEAEAKDESRPKVISVFPSDGAESVEPVTGLRVRFDRPMDPLALKLDWKSGGCLESEFPRYDSKNNEFTIPLRLAPGTVHQLVVNRPIRKSLRESRANFPRDGFQSIDHHLARLFDWKFKTKDAAPIPAGAKPAQVLKISPLPGSQVPYRALLELQFDQPMKPPSEALPFLNKHYDPKEPTLVPRVRYDPGSHTFGLSLLLLPRHKSTFILTGFYSAAGLPSEPITLEYLVSDEELSSIDRRKIEAGEKDPRLLKILQSMQRERTNITSLVERIQSLSMSRGEGGLFASLKSQSASFKWQKPDQFYSDATDVMYTSSAFVIGCDGQTCWWQDGSPGEGATNLVICPLKDIQRIDLSLCDPFDLSYKTLAQAASEMDLNYVGDSELGGSKCHVIEGWVWDNVTPFMTPIGFRSQWWIDRRTSRLLENLVYWDNGVKRVRFFYDTVNQPLPVGEFGIPKIHGLSPVPAESLGVGYTNRFINLRDGSDGNMNIRYGKEGPEGKSWSGYVEFN